MRDYLLEFQQAVSSIGKHKHTSGRQDSINLFLSIALECKEKCEKPVIAASHGIAMGGAIDLLAACDIRYAASDSIFSIKEVDCGLAADVGTLSRFPRIVGNDSMSRELALTARNFGAQEAKEIGFVSKVVQGSRQEVVGELD